MRISPCFRPPWWIAPILNGVLEAAAVKFKNVIGP